MALQITSCKVVLCPLLHHIPVPSVAISHDAGELEAETAALLEMEKVSDVEFTPEVLACLPEEDEEWSISPEERAQRTDFTGLRCAEVLSYQLWEVFCTFLSRFQKTQHGHDPASA